MADQICPVCKSESFTWSVDEEISLTRWDCRHCGYMAYEDESLERVCADCKTKTELRLGDGQRMYWWCSRCNKVTEIEE